MYTQDDKYKREFEFGGMGGRRMFRRQMRRAMRHNWSGHSAAPRFVWIAGSIVMGIIAINLMIFALKALFFMLPLILVGGAIFFAVRMFKRMSLQGWDNATMNKDWRGMGDQFQQRMDAGAEKMKRGFSAMRAEWEADQTDDQENGSDDQSQTKRKNDTAANGGVFYA